MRFSALARVLGAMVLLGTAGSAQASSLYDDLGGQPGVAGIVEHMMDHVLKDPRIAPIFSESNIPRVKAQLADQFCALADGPCVYKGHSMKAAHRGLKIDEAAFYALVEDLQDGMDEAGIGFHTQNRLLAKLAPFYDEVVTR